ncbi:MAG TPA: gamma-glutamyl-gamma-aminobutyrate hydrolase family protein [Steroidobacteraceae bacterium]|jgi:GMP synthase (glutamine-hydrolysing)|nr:gamma-glutamyl-gamma-aminobutyrate hydrolase family protein [Steroidobacteraceae bacterium]
MRKLLVFQHSAREPLGILDPMLRQHGFRIRYLNFSRQPDLQPDVSRYDGLVVLGGAMNVDQSDRYPHLTAEIGAIQEALKRDIPILGICLGAQLLAAALGANVRPHSVREIGWYRLHPTSHAQSDRLCRHFDGSQHVFQWHAYTFDLPPGAVHLASTATCPNQAFRYGDKAYGLQFHPEADHELIQRWLHVPEYRAEAEASGPQHQLEHILRDTHGHAPHARAVSERVFGEFLEMFAWRKKVRLGSL